MTDAVNNPDLDLFARVKDGAIVEFPVYRLHIHNRAHPLSWYTPVIESPKPELPPFHYYDQQLTVAVGHVKATYSVKAYTLAELLSQLRPFSPIPGEPLPPVPAIADLDPALVARIYGLASDYLTDKLVAFAATRNYGTPTVDAFTSLLTYLTSTVAKFKAEAERGQLLRDTAWSNMIAYFDQVMAGTLPVPTSISTIDALIPQMTWPDQDPV